MDATPEVDEHLVDCWTVRHGQSLAQLDQADPLDPDLSPRGEAQAKRLRKLLTDVRFDAVLISPLTRTRRTYELAGIGHPNACFDSRLLEWYEDDRRYGEILPPPHHPRIAPDRHRAWTLPFHERVDAMIDGLMELRGQRVLLVAHTGFLGALLKVALTGGHADDFGGSHLDNCALSRIRFDPEHRRGMVVWWNRVQHIIDLLDGGLYGYLQDRQTERIEER